jgi:D-3-phosphoglycerate dehydrogenase
LLDPSYDDVLSAASEGYDVIFTNPNKQRFVIDGELLRCSNVKIVCTASTGLNHIDLRACEKFGVTVLSLTKQLNVIERITSTAELALALSFAIVRNIPAAVRHTETLQWNYEPFVGRQLNSMVLGVIGFGRLGKMMCNMSKNIFADIIVYDPYAEIPAKFLLANSLSDCLRTADVVSLHVHLNEETHRLINAETLKQMKPRSFLVNTSRGAIVDEQAIIEALDRKQLAGYATDVVCDELSDISKSIIVNSQRNRNVIVTPHIGGMTIEAQKIAYHATVDMLEKKLLYG